MLILVENFRFLLENGKLSEIYVSDQIIEK